jgi:hypothetical protein
MGVLFSCLAKIKVVFFYQPKGLNANSIAALIVARMSGTVFICHQTGKIQVPAGKNYQPDGAPLTRIENELTFGEPGGNPHSASCDARLSKFSPAEYRLPVPALAFGHGGDHGAVFFSVSADPPGLPSASTRTPPV